MAVTTESYKNMELREAIRNLTTAIELMNARLAALPNDATAITNTTVKTLLTI